MIQIILEKDIEYTYGDTFTLRIYPKVEGLFENGMQLRFVIAKTEESEYIIDKMIGINEDLEFILTLNDNEKAKLPKGDYIYKLSTYKNNTIVTEKSGYFKVKWGA